MLLVLGVLAPALAHATTLAVLPLEKGAAGQEYEGLGTAIAGMIVSDLVGAPGLEIVERERLDDLLTEVELGESGFVDPKTAQKLGKGLGAELVLIGSYSVVKDTLALDGRLVEVESGRVLDGAAADGPVQDFVTVEKTLVEGLMVHLDTTLDARGRRAFYSRVPTESWEAFKAYSRGEARVGAGELDAARSAFQEALAADPEFTAAIEGLTALQDLIARSRQQDRSARSSRYEAAENAVLAATTDPRTRSAKTPWTDEELAGFAVRLSVLFEQERWCDRYDEMMAYMDLVDWQPRAHRDSLFPHVGAFYVGMTNVEKSTGHARWTRDDRHAEHRIVVESIRNREGELWEDEHLFLFDSLTLLHDHSDVGAAQSLLRCHDARTRAKELDRWEAALKKHGQLDVAESGPRRSGLSNRLQLDVLRAWSEAEEGRVTPARLAPLQLELEAHPDDQHPMRRRLLSLLDKIATHADRQDQRNVNRLGLSEATIRAHVEALRDGTAPFKADRREWCTELYKVRWQDAARRILEYWDKDIEDQDFPYHSIRNGAQLVRKAGDMGCLDGVEPAFDGPADLREQLHTFRARQHPVHGESSTCRSNMDSLDRLLTMPDGMMNANLTESTFDMYLNLLQNRCVVEP